MTRTQSMSFRIVAAGLVILLAGIAIGFWLVPRDEAARLAEGEQEILYWYDPMVPGQHFDKPGKSPFMDMDLVPRYADEPGEAPGVRIDAAMTQNLGVRTAIVERGPIATTIRAAGVVEYNGREIAVVQARASGFVIRSLQRAVGDVVRAGDALIDLRVPEWTAALAEYLALRSGDPDIAAAARQRLAMLAVPEDAISASVSSGEAPAAFTIRAPISGAITSLEVREGMTLASGASIATINGLSPVWITASVPQGVAGAISADSVAQVSLPAFPGETFAGRIEAVLPAADPASRAVEVRIALPNPDGRLRPGMTGEVDLSDSSPRQALLAPYEAIIRTGLRTLVITAGDNGRYEPVEIVTGERMGDHIEIVSGLSEGQRVVASGQFLIDSEASLSGAIARLSGSQAPASDFYEAAGIVTAIDAQSVTLAHGPVPQLNWPAMTMAFQWDGSPQPLAVGDEVTLTFHREGDGYVIDRMTRTGDRQ